MPTLENLKYALNKGIKLPPALKKEHDRLVAEQDAEAKRATEWDGVLAELAEIDAAEEAERQARIDAANITFPGVPQADDDVVVVGRRRSESGFWLTHKSDGTADFFYSHMPPIPVGETNDGKTTRRYRFNEWRTIHYVPRAVWNLVPKFFQDRVDASWAPDDVWRWSGGVQNFLPFNRGRSIDGREGQPSEEELTAATAKAIEKCRDLVAGCVDVALLRTWRDNAGSAGEASGVLRAVIEKRLAALGADDARGEAA